MKRLESINVWNRSCDLIIHTYRAINHLENNILRDAAARSSLSVVENIAQAYDDCDDSSAKFCACLADARGACAVLRTLLYLADQLEVLESQSAHKLITESLEVSNLLDGLIECFRIDA